MKYTNFKIYFLLKINEANLTIHIINDALTTNNQDNRSPNIFVCGLINFSSLLNRYF